ncbi:MAG: lysostaphin resistance A-like protein [Rhodanobacteraceae bacterium]
MAIVSSAFLPQATPMWKRVVNFPLASLLIEVALIAVPIITIMSLGLQKELLHDNGNLVLLVGAVISVISCLWYGFYFRLFHRALGTQLSWNVHIAGIGFALGVALFGVVMLMLWTFGGLGVVATNPADVLAKALGLAVASGVTEEIIVRGIIFRNLERLAGTWISLAVTALLFGAMHLGNAHATTLSSLAIALESGVLLATAYVATRTLWWPIGIHIGWNFSEGGIFGLAVSGGESQGLIQVSTEGSPWLTGGDFGPEASALAVLVCLAATVVFLVLASKRKQIVAPLEYKRRAARAASI